MQSLPRAGKRATRKSAGKHAAGAERGEKRASRTSAGKHADGAQRGKTCIPCLARENETGEKRPEQRAGKCVIADIFGKELRRHQNSICPVHGTQLQPYSIALDLSLLQKHEEDAQTHMAYPALDSKESVAPRSNVNLQYGITLRPVKRDIMQ